MASGIVGVEPLEQPGTFRASLAGGGSMLVHGQPGADLYERFKPKPEALGPDATADASSLMSTPGENMSRADVPMGGPAPARDPAARSMAQELVGPAPATTQASYSPGPAPERQMPEATEQPRQTGPVSMGMNMEGIDPATQKKVMGEGLRMPDGSIAIRLPGSRGTPGGLTSLGKEALQHQGAAEDEAARQRAIEAQARETGVDAAKQEAEQRAAYLDEAKIQSMLAIQQQQDEQAKVQEQVAQLQSKYDKARDDFMDSKVDPDEYMKRNGGAVGMFSALGVAMAQFGGAFTGQPNVAMQFVNNQIDRSIKAQETQINIKGRAADNMLADLTREMGSLSAAKLSMRQLLTERSAIEMQQIGASTKSQQIQSLATETAAKAAGQAALLDQARKQGYLEHVMSSPLYYRQGRAGSAPRIALPTQEAVGKATQTGIDVDKLSIEKAKAAADAAKERPGGKVPDTVKKSIAELDAAIAGIKRMSEVDEAEGRPNVLMTEGGTGSFDSTKKLVASADAVAPGVARAIEGDAATQSSMDAAKRGLMSRSPEQREQAREQYLQQLLTKRATILKSQ